MYSELNKQKMHLSRATVQKNIGLVGRMIDKSLASKKKKLPVPSLAAVTLLERTLAEGLQHPSNLETDAPGSILVRLRLEKSNVRRRPLKTTRIKMREIRYWTGQMLKSFQNFPK